MQKEVIWQIVDHLCFSGIYRGAEENTGLIIRTKYLWSSEHPVEFATLHRPFPAHCCRSGLPMLHRQRTTARSVFC